jgi:GDP-L-fucose synthase
MTQNSGARLSPQSKIFIADHRGFVGSALHRALQMRGQRNLLVRTPRELDLTSQSAVNEFFADERPEYVLLAVSNGSGAHGYSSRPAEFISENLLMETNLIDAAYRNGAKKLVFLGAAGLQQREAQLVDEGPMRSRQTTTVNDTDTVAKLAGLTMCQAYRRQYGFDAIVATPAELYGPGDLFDAENSRVVPALIRRFYEAAATDSKEIAIHGTGTQRRELLHVDDFAAAVLLLLDRYSGEPPIEVGSGEDIPVIELARVIADECEFEGTILPGPADRDEALAKPLDSTPLQKLGWRPKIGWEEGVRKTYQWYASHRSLARPLHRWPRLRQLSPKRLSTLKTRIELR